MNNYTKYDAQNLASPQEEEDVPASSEVVAARSKAKAKPQPRESTGTTTIPLSERMWIDIVPSKKDLDSHNLSKKVINLLRHNQKLHREQNGAVQFYKTPFHLRDYSLPIQNWSDRRWLACLAAGGGPKEDIIIALIPCGQSFISVLFKDILGTVSLIRQCRIMY